jgi:hypothetical protein
VAFDLVIEIENSAGALAQVAAAISDAGVNIAAATCIGTAEKAELHILVKHAEAVKHSLAISHLAVTREREVVVVDVEDRPGVLADRLAVGTDARAERYWQLLAIINGWPPVPTTVPAWEWLIAALRRRPARP